MSNRHQRRADVASFRRQASHGLLTYLIDADDTALAQEPLFSGAVTYWRSGITTRKPVCISCRAVFTAEGAQPGAFLFAVAPAAPKSASVSGICVRCWQRLSDDEITAMAVRTLRTLMPNAKKFEA